MFREVTRTFVMSKKEKDADAIIDRIKSIYERLPEGIKKKYPADDFTYLNIKWSKSNSIIQGLAQGPDQIRQYTASLVIMDEGAFQEKAAKTWEAIRPSLVGGGKFVVISTPNGKEWFYAVRSDLL
jgi:phage FluMu gp28-like protein